MGIVGGLLVLVARAYLTRGMADASALFQLLQGVILSTLAYLFAAQAADRAEQAVIAERKQRAVMESGSEAAEDLDALRRDLADALAVMDRLARDPDIGRQVQAVMRQAGGDEHATRDHDAA